LNEKDDLAMKVATFRFGVIADFVTGVRLGYGEKERLLNEKAERAVPLRVDLAQKSCVRLTKSFSFHWRVPSKEKGLRPA
jgi:hypothetical protein